MQFGGPWASGAQLVLRVEEWGHHSLPSGLCRWTSQRANGKSGWKGWTPFERPSGTARFRRNGLTTRVLQSGPTSRETDFTVCLWNGWNSSIVSVLTSARTVIGYPVFSSWWNSNVPTDTATFRRVGRRILSWARGCQVSALAKPACQASPLAGKSIFAGVGIAPAVSETHAERGARGQTR